MRRITHSFLGEPCVIRFIVSNISQYAMLPGEEMALLPQLVAVDNVLPQHVGAGTDGGERVQVGVCHPDGKHGVLLPQCLPAADTLAVCPPIRLPR